jgi:RAB protein geranylgeranyltransferase component A
MSMSEFRILSDLNTYHIKPIVNKVISELRNLKDDQFLHSGEDSGLINVWDEICVQVQGEYYFNWDDYESTIYNFAQALFKKLPDAIKNLINYMGSISQHEDEEYMCDSFGIQEIVNQVLIVAMDYENSRIRRYLENDFD